VRVVKNGKQNVDVKDINKIYLCQGRRDKSKINRIGFLLACQFIRGGIAMPRFRQTSDILRLMGKKEDIRNIGIIAHIDHGKRI